MEGPSSHGERNQIAQAQKDMKRWGVRAQPSPQTMQLCNAEPRSRIDGLREDLMIRIKETAEKLRTVSSFLYRHDKHSHNSKNGWTTANRRDRDVKER